MCAKYIALTGATGLLGSYLLKDLLQTGCAVAVLVRGNRTEDAKGRIEFVLSRFEKTLGHPLPRPVILESDLGKPDLGLSNNDREWITRHVDTMLHNAASLEFLFDKKSGEPFRSNVEGTNHVLELCRICKIRQFHHVSTAYVCGLRVGNVLETELQCGQQFGNAYEESKLTSETAVRNAEYLDRVTVYRPAIIVGDSQTGYTPTFHGFYTPLKILYPLIDGKDVTPGGVAELIAAMGMNGGDEKNFVPVDWISSVMTHIITTPKWHERCYHLSPSNRTRIDVMCDVLVEALRIPKKTTLSTMFPEKENLNSLAETFMSQMNVYRAYWRNDPEFDRTNTLQATGHIPCPVMDEDRMRTLTRYAINSNFGWPKPRPTVLSFDSDAILRKQCERLTLSTDGLSEIGFQIVGPGGGDWCIRQDKSGRLICQPGLPQESLPTVRMNASLFEQMIRGDSTPGRLLPGDLAWENTNDDWIEQYGNKMIETIVGT